MSYANDFMVRFPEFDSPKVRRENGKSGWTEILVILGVALMIFGPRKLPELGKSLGASLAQFRRASEDFKRTWEDEVETEKRRLETAITAPVEAERPAPVVTTRDEEMPATAFEETSTLVETAPPPSAEEAPAAVDDSASVARETRRDWM